MQPIALREGSVSFRDSGATAFTVNDNPTLVLNGRAVGIAAQRPEGRKAMIAGSSEQSLKQSKLNGNVTRGAEVIPLEKLRNLKERICSFENLFEAFISAADGKHDRAEVLDFAWNLEENLISIRRDLLNRTYQVGPYREFYVRYPKPRLVMALGFRDRVVQWAIYRQIDPYVDKRFITHSYGCRRDKGTLAAAECLLNWVRIISRKPDATEYCLIKDDISKFFYRVHHGTVLDQYAEISDDDWFLWLMDVIVNNPDVPFGLPEGMGIDDCPRDQRLYDVGQPIGNLTSQETANVYLNKLDLFCKHVLRLHYYVRYMDDFCIIVKGKENAERINAEIGTFLKGELMLELSAKSKILPANGQTEFVGYIVSPHGLRLRKKTTKHIKNALKCIRDLYAIGAIPREKALATIDSYMGLTVHCNGHNLRRWIRDNIILERRESAQ